MPHEFYPDTDRTGLRPVEQTCYHHITGFDGPFICKRPKNHKVDEVGPITLEGEYHQEEYEGWVWNDRKQVG